MHHLGTHATVIIGLLDLEGGARFPLSTVGAL